MKDRKSNEKTFVLHFLLHHGWPGLQEKHEELKVFPLLRSSQQLQEEGVSFLLILHIFCLNLSGSVKRKANQFETRKQKGPAVRVLNGKYPQVIEHRAQISRMMCSGELPSASFKSCYERNVADDRYDKWQDQTLRGGFSVIYHLDHIRKTLSNTSATETREQLSMIPNDVCSQL